MSQFQLQSPEHVRVLLARAEQQRQRIANYPREKILAILDAVGQSWSNPHYEPRKKALEILPALTGFSRKMVDLGLNELAKIFSADLLRHKLNTELNTICSHDGHTFRKSRDGKISLLHWQPLGKILHVLSGNVFLVGPGSMVEGLMTGNVTLLKMPTSETFFMPLFLETLKSHDTEQVVSDSILLLEYASSQKDVLNELKDNVDGIVVWGGEQAVRAYRENLPAKTRMVVFGPKLSIAMISSVGIRTQNLDVICNHLALELAIWDQNACTAPQICFVESENLAHKVANGLVGAMERISHTLPPGKLDSDTAVEIRKLRGVAEVAEARGAAELYTSENSLDWTVILEKNGEIETSPLHRTLRVIPFDQPQVVFAQMAQLRGYIQTVGIACNPVEVADWYPQLAQAGVQRMMPLGMMAQSEIDDPHDGAYTLPQLLQLVVSKVDAQAEISLRFVELIEKARRSPYYAALLEDRKIRSISDLKELPILSRKEMENLTPPRSEALRTRPVVGGYLAKSGGSTGEGKYVIFDGKDWRAMMKHAVAMFRACGLSETDRLANFMRAGDLYGSFVSFNQVNEMLGLTSLAFTVTTPASVVVDTWRQFRFNAVQGLPTALLKILRDCKTIEPEFCLEKVMFGGVSMSEIDKKWLRDALGVKTITSVIGASEVGQIAYQCPNQTGNLHHLVDDFNYIECVDDEGCVVPEGQVGRLLVTTLQKHNYPLIRYDMGDQGAVFTSSCTCGVRGRVLHYNGRSDDLIRMGLVGSGLMNISYNEVLKVLAEIPMCALQISAKYKQLTGHRADVLVLNIETTMNSNQYSQLRESVISALCNKIHDFANNYRNETFLLEIDLVKEGSLPRNARSGKIQTMIDERQ